MTPMELFFDLVFIFALVQVTEFMAVGVAPGTGERGDGGHGDVVAEQQRGRSGAVVVPEASADRIVAGAERIRRTDQEYLPVIRDENVEALRRGDRRSTES